MRKVVNIDLQQHKALKDYCRGKDVTMREVLNGLIDFITVNDIHPMRYLKLGDEELFSFREEILSEIKKNRNTYVSFQRTFEKQYEKDILFLKETLLFSLRKVLAASVRGSQKEKSLSTILEFFLIMMVEEKIVSYNIKHSKNLPIVYDKATAKLLKENKYYLTDIQELAQLIIDNYGVLPDAKRNPKQQK